MDRKLQRFGVELTARFRCGLEKLDQTHGA